MPAALPAALLAALAGSAALLPASAASAATAPASCPKVLFVGVRGSGQRPSDDGGYGDTVQAVRDGFTASLPGSVSSQSVALKYPAAPVPLASASDAAWERLLQSITDGTRALQRVLTTSERTCTGSRAQKWVLAGYSQGALVVNQAVRGFPASHFARIDLIGDPARVPDQAGTQTGSAQPGYGIAALIKIAHVRGPLPRQFGAVTTSLCDDEDLICDYSHLATAAQGTYGGQVHTTYATRDAPVLQSIGAQAADDAADPASPAYAPGSGGTVALGSLPAGHVVDSVITGLAPGEAVEAVLESDPRALGTVRADGDGVAQYSFTVPKALPRGQHQLVLFSGTGAVSRTFWVGPAGTPAPSGTPGNQAVLKAPAAFRAPVPPAHHAALIAVIATAVAALVAATGAFLSWRHRRSGA